MPEVGGRLSIMTKIKLPAFRKHFGNSCADPEIFIILEAVQPKLLFFYVYSNKGAGSNPNKNDPIFVKISNAGSGAVVV